MVVERLKGSSDNDGLVLLDSFRQVYNVNLGAPSKSPGFTVRTATFRGLGDVAGVGVLQEVNVTSGPNASSADAFGADGGGTVSYSAFASRCCFQSVTV